MAAPCFDFLHTSPRGKSPSREEKVNYIIMPVLPISEQNPSHIVRPCWARTEGFPPICFHKKGHIFQPTTLGSSSGPNFLPTIKKVVPWVLNLQWHSQRDLHAKNDQCLHTVYITGPQCLSSNHFTFPPAKQQISHFTRLSHSFRRDGAILSVGDMANQGYPKPPLWAENAKKHQFYVFHSPIFRSNTKWECVWDVWESFSKSLQRKRLASQYSLHNLPFFFVGFLFFSSFLFLDLVLQNPSFIGMLASILRLEPGGVPHRIFPFPVPHQGDRRPEHRGARLVRKRRRQGGAHGALPLAHLRVWLRVVYPASEPQQLKGRV